MNGELQNCFAEAQMAYSEAQAKENEDINEICKSGYYAVVYRRLWHCNSTDAVVGEFTQFICGMEFRDEAEARAKELNGDDACGDAYYCVA